MYEISSYMKTFFGSMYEISSCYDMGFFIDEIMLYLIMYELFHDPYMLHQSYQLTDYCIFKIITRYHTSSPLAVLRSTEQQSCSV